MPAASNSPQISLTTAPAKRSMAPAAVPGGPAGGEARWYLHTEQGQQYGPISKTELDGWVMEGRVSAGAQLLKEGETNWRIAGEQYPVLASAAPAASSFASGGPAPNPFGGGGQVAPYGGGNANPFADNYANPFAAPQTTTASSYSPRRREKPHRGAVILTFAILGWLVCAIFGIVAWVMGNADLEEMRRGRMDREGEGLTRAGMILGMVQTIICGIGIAFLIFMMALGGMR